MSGATSSAASGLLRCVASNQRGHAETRLLEVLHAAHRKRLAITCASRWRSWRVSTSGCAVAAGAVQQVPDQVLLVQRRQTVEGPPEAVCLHRLLCDQGARHIQVLNAAMRTCSFQVQHSVSSSQRLQQQASGRAPRTRAAVVLFWPFVQACGSNPSRDHPNLRLGPCADAAVSGARRPPISCCSSIKCPRPHVSACSRSIDAHVWRQLQP